MANSDEDDYLSSLSHVEICGMVSAKIDQLVKVSDWSLI